MVTHIFSQSNATFLSKFGRPRFRYDHADNRLVLFIECQEALPPSWFKSLRTEIISDDGSSRTPVDFDWTETEDSLVVAQATCPEAYRLTGDSDMLPISRIILIAGGIEVSLDNMRSPKAFAAREMNPIPTI